MFAFVGNKKLSFPARFSNTPKFSIFRRLRLFPYPFYQLQIFYIEAICCALEPERISPSFTTRHQSYSSEPSSSFIFSLFTTPQKQKKNIFRAIITTAPPHSKADSHSKYRYSLNTRQQYRYFPTKIAHNKTSSNNSHHILHSSTVHYFHSSTYPAITAIYTSSNIMPTAPTAPSNSFDLLKEFFNDDVENENETITDQDAEADDATMNGSNKSSPSLTRITFKVPADELAKDKAKAILLVAKEVLDCFQAEFPTMKLLPWKTENVSPLSCTRKSLPTDPKLAESFLFGYSRFFAKPSGIFRVLFQHDSPIAREEIEEFAKLNINQPRIQFLQPAQSDAIQPTILGFLTGSTPDMASSPAVEAVLKKTFNIKVLGMQ
jgi:rRNA maturation protein Nop10